MKFAKFYIVTFEERMRIGREYEWVEGSRVYENIEAVRDFLKEMYEVNEGNFRHAHVWYGVEVSHEVVVEVKFDEDLKDW